MSAFFRNIAHSISDCIYRGFDVYFFSLNKSLTARFLFGNAKNTLKNFCTASSYQTGNSQNFSLMDFKAYILELPFSGKISGLKKHFIGNFSLDSTRNLYLFPSHLINHFFFCDFRDMDFFYKASVLHNSDSVCLFHNLIQVMSNKYHSCAAFFQPLHGLKETFCLTIGQNRCRLIQNQYFWIIGKRPGNRNKLLIRCRKHFYRLRNIYMNIQKRKKSLCLLTGLCPVDQLFLHDFISQKNIFRNTGFWYKIQLLRYQNNIFSHCFSGGGEPDRFSLHDHLSAVHCKLPGQNVH